LSRDSSQPLQQLYCAFWFLDFHWVTLLDFWFLGSLVVLDGLRTYPNKNYFYKWVGHLTENMSLSHQQLYHALQFLDFYWIISLDLWFLDYVIMLSKLIIYPNEIHFLKVVEMSWPPHQKHVTVTPATLLHFLVSWLPLGYFTRFLVPRLSGSLG